MVRVCFVEPNVLIDFGCFSTPNAFKKYVDSIIYRHDANIKRYGVIGQKENSLNLSNVALTSVNIYIYITPTF